MAERVVRNDEVVGSNPITSTKRASFEPRSGNGLGFVLAPSMIQPRNPSSWKAAITLIYRANGALELDDLFGPSSVESDTQVKTQSNEGNNQAR